MFASCTPLDRPIVADECAPDDTECAAATTAQPDGSTVDPSITGGTGAQTSNGTNSNGINGNGINGPAANGSGANGNGANGNGANGNGTNGNGTNGNGANGNGADPNGTNGNGANGGSPGANGGPNGTQGAAPNMAKCGNGSIDMGETCDPAATCPSAATCISTNVCLKPMLLGMPSMCNATCEFAPIEDCKHGDGCCPQGCNIATDDDCSDSCGDGVIGKGETCEPTSSEKPCPTSCDDMDPCTKDTQTGTPAQCNVECTNTPITQPAGGDKCCPEGANANNDSDCKVMCGNGVKEDGEKCDGDDCPTSCDDGDECTADKLMGNAKACSAECSNTPITRPAGGDGCCPDGANANNDSDCSAKCGNGVKEGNEKCDGSDCPRSCDDGKPCTMDIPVGSASQCTADCTHKPITSPANNDGCCPDRANANNDNDCRPKCGNGVTEGSETCDGDCDRVRAKCGSVTKCTKPGSVGEDSACNVACGPVMVIGAGKENACGGCETLPHPGLSPGDAKVGDICHPSTSTFPECDTAGVTECSGKDFMVCNVRPDVAANPDNNCAIPDFDDNCDGRRDEGPVITCPQ